APGTAASRCRAKARAAASPAEPATRPPRSHSDWKSAHICGSLRWRISYTVVIAGSEATKQSSPRQNKSGLLRCARNDEAGNRLAERADIRSPACPSRNADPDRFDDVGP